MHYNMHRTNQIGIHSWIKKKTSTSLCKHLDICWDCGPWTILDPHKEFQNLIQVYIYRNSCLISSCMWTAMLTMLFDNIQLQKEFNVHIKKIWRTFWKSFYTVSNLLNFQILCIWLNKAYFIYGFYCSGKWCCQRASCLKLSKIDHQRK